MHALMSQAEFDAALAQLAGRHPDAEQYQRLAGLVLDHPGAHALARLDPFSPGYRGAVLELYAALRGRPGDTTYLPERDEAPESGGTLPADLWTGLVPWSFRSPALSAEFLLSWGHILRHLGVAAGQSVLEYGPGSGQILLLLARMGVQAHGVDIDATALDGIGRQAEALGLAVPLERAPFGEGFAAERFDAILFFEAFHHALEFPDLLRRLRDRLRPGGRLVLCGEPIVDAPIPGIPYPWGPRLDALSVYCMRRWGWMELGFTRPFFVEAARRAGWDVAYHPFPGCGRACAFVLTPAGAVPAGDAPVPAEAQHPQPWSDDREQLEAMRRSTSWRVTRPLRALGRLRWR